MVVTCGDGPIDFQATEEPLDLVAPPAEFAVVVDLHAALGAIGDDGPYVSAGKGGADSHSIARLEAAARRQP